MSAIRATLDAYQNRVIALDQLVRRMKGYIAALEEVADSGWVEELRTLWWNLEYVNAFWIEDGKPRLSLDDEAKINSHVSEIRSMLTQY